LIRGGRVVAEYFKALLPNYSVFDEKRYFEPGGAPCVFDLHGVPVGHHDLRGHLVPGAGRARQGGGRAPCSFNLNASPFHKGKAPEREELVGKRARRETASRSCT